MKPSPREEAAEHALLALEFEMSAAILGEHHLSFPILMLESAKHKHWAETILRKTPS